MILERDKHLMGAEITWLCYGAECFDPRPISKITVKTKDGRLFDIMAQELRYDIADLEVRETDAHRCEDD